MSGRSNIGGVSSAQDSGPGYLPSQVPSLILFNLFSIHPFLWMFLLAGSQSRLEGSTLIQQDPTYSKSQIIDFFTKQQYPSKLKAQEE